MHPENDCFAIDNYAAMQYSIYMKRKITQTRQFSKAVDDLIKKRQLLHDDFEEFKRELAEHPEMGDLVTGTGGLRKIRLKSASRGKSGSFRVCYLLFCAR